MVAALLLLCTPLSVIVEPAPPADGFVLLADDWARPRTGASVAAMPALRAAVAAWHAAPGARLAIVHPGGETGGLWGREVRDWLVALGLAPADLVLRPGGPREDAVLLRLERRP